MSNEDSRSLVEHAADLRNEAEAKRQAQRVKDDKWHVTRLRIYYGLVGVPAVTTAGLLIFLIVDKLWEHFN